MTSHNSLRAVPIALLASVAGLQAQPTFSSLTMIDPNGSQSSRASAINASGQVLVDDRSGNLFLWSGGVSTQITDTLGTGSVYSAWTGGLNDAGQVAGQVEDGESYRYFIWSSGGGMTELDTQYVEEVNGLNNSGQVVGRALGEPNYSFVWSSGGGTTPLTNTDGTTVYDNTYARAINSSGQVVGLAIDSSDNQVAVRWETNGDMTVIPVSGDANASAINDSGHVVGSFYDGNTDSYKAFYWDGTTLTTIDALPGDDEIFASAINANGDIVGGSEGSDEHAVLYTGGQLYDLNSLAASFLVEYDGETAGFVRLGTAFGINDAGQIVGEGSYYDGLNYFRAC